MLTYVQVIQSLVCIDILGPSQHATFAMDYSVASVMNNGVLLQNNPNCDIHFVYYRRNGKCCCTSIGPPKPCDTTSTTTLGVCRAAISGDEIHSVASLRLLYLYDSAGTLPSENLET